MFLYLKLVKQNLRSRFRPNESLVVRRLALCASLINSESTRIETANTRNLEQPICAGNHAVSTCRQTTHPSSFFSSNEITSNSWSHEKIANRMSVSIWHFREALAIECIHVRPLNNDVRGLTITNNTVWRGQPGAYIFPLGPDNRTPRIDTGSCISEGFKCKP